VKSKVIGIITPGRRNNCFNGWDPESVKDGVPGSEESVIYIAQELAALGHRVIIAGDPPPGSVHSLPSANPQYVSASEPFDVQLDFAIAWNRPDVRPLRKFSRKVYYWPHGICTHRLSAEEIDAFDGVLWTSEWQRKFWCSFNPGMEKFSDIWSLGIVPEQFAPVQERVNPYSCIYGSNYARGLATLLELWPSVKKRFSRATLDIYYGWQHWGALSPESEQAIRNKLSSLNHLGVAEHGRVGHEELNQAYGRASLWTYPCFECETFCITALRAQMAGTVPVVHQWSALNETVRHGYRCSRYADFPALLFKALSEAERITVHERKKMGEFILKEFTWKELAIQWNRRFES
jgi:glycosyltransferase involved in cell wall biosynthesis